MSTITKDKSGKVVKAMQDTEYHPDGTGPRDSDGKPITDREPGIDADAVQTFKADVLGDTEAAASMKKDAKP